MNTKPAIKFILSVFILFVAVLYANAQTNTASTSGAWGTPGNWSLGHVPLATENVDVPVGFAMTVGVAANCANLSIEGSVTITAAFSLSVAGNFTNTGTFSAPANTTLTFNGSGNRTVISGGGTYTTIAGTVVMNLAASSDTLDIQDAKFIGGINTGAKYYFTFTQGTWYMDETTTALNDCYNSGSATALTILPNAIIEVNAGATMNLALKGTTQNVLLEGELFVNGGTVNVQTGQAHNAFQDFRYKSVGVTTPALVVVNNGTLNIGAGFNAFTQPADAVDSVSFSMTSGIISCAVNGYSDYTTFQVNNVKGSKTTMAAGSIILEQGVNGGYPDVDFGGNLISPYVVTGGTIQFGAASTTNGTTFSFEAYPAPNYYPNFYVYPCPLTANKVQPINTSNFGVYSLNIAAGTTFDMVSWVGGAGSNTLTMTIYGSDGTNAFYNAGTFTQSNSTVVFSGSLTQVINSTAAAQTFYNLTINNGGTATTTCGGAITSLTTNTFTVNAGIFSPAPANGGTVTSMTINGDCVLNTGIGSTFNAPPTITLAGNWTNNGGTFNSNNGLVIFNGGNKNINGTAVSQSFYDVQISNTTTISGSTVTLNVLDIYTQTAGTFTGPAAFVLNIGLDFFLNAGTFTATAGSFINIARNWSWTNGSVFTPSSSTVTFNGTVNQAVEGTKATQTFYNLVVNNTGTGTSLTYGGSCTTVIVTNMLTMTSGIFNVSTNTLSGAGKITATGGDLQIAKLATEPELTGAYTITGGNVTLNGAGAQTLQPSCSTYYNLVFTNSGAKTITGFAPQLNVNGNFTVSGSATIPATNSQINQAAAKTFYYYSTGATTLKNGVLVTLGSYNQNGAGGTFADGGCTINITGAAFTLTAGTFTSTGTEVFKGNLIQQSITGSGLTFNKLTLNNSYSNPDSALTINNDVTVSNTLLFTAGDIITGSNNMIITSTGTVTGGGTGWIIGNERKWLAVGAPTAMTYELGCKYYSPINLSATVTGAGYVTCSFTEIEHPDIASSMINVNSDVAAYWTITNTSATITTYGSTFNFNNNDLTASAVPASFNIQQYDGISWHNTTVSAQNANSTAFTGENAYGDFAIGNFILSSGIYNAVTGAMNWNNKANWIQYESGTISSSTLSTTITGVGTTFTTQLQAGDVILLQSTPGSALGTVSVVNSNTQVTLTGNAAATTAGVGFGRQVVPGVNDGINKAANDVVNIGNPNIALAGTTVTYNMSGDTILQLVFTGGMNVANTVTQSGANVLYINNDVYINQPNSANTNQWLINGGTASIAGNLYIGSIDATAGHNAYVGVTSGTLTEKLNLVYNSSTASCVVLDLSGAPATGTVNLGSVLDLPLGAGTLTPGSSGSIFNYNMSNPGTQSVVMNNANINYDNLAINATCSGGATLNNPVTAANVIGNITVGNGLNSCTFHNGGYAITGNAGATFQVYNSSIFEMSGTSTYPTGFGTFTYGTSSTEQYHQTASMTITAATYGNLQLEPAFNGVTYEFPATTTTVAGNLTLGNGTNTGITIDANTNNSPVTVAGSLFLYSNTTFSGNGNAINPINIGGNWTNNGGTYTPNNGTVNFNGTANQSINGTQATQTLYNVTINESPNTVVLSTGGSTTTLNLNSITMTTGSFNAPATLNISSNLTLAGTSGVFNAAANINIGGNWTENAGCTFNPNNGTITFNGTTNQSITGSLATEAYYNFVINNTGAAGSNTINASSFANLATQNLTLTKGNFTAPVIFSVNGNLTQASTFGIFSTGSTTNLYVGGNWTYNGGTFTPGTTIITLNGNTAQTLGGTLNFPSIANIVINNTSHPAYKAITLNTPLTITSALTLTSGDIITNQTDLLSLNAGAGSVTVNINPFNAGNNTQDSSYVSGPMVQTVAEIGPHTWLFPVGAINHMVLAELNLNQTVAATTTYNCQFFVANANAMFASLAPINNVSQYGYWKIFQNPITTAFTSTITLFYNNYFNVPFPANLRVAIAIGDAGPWTNNGGTGTSACSGASPPACQGDILSTITFNTSSNYFTLGSTTPGNNPLPIELLYFNAKCDNNKTNLTWATASETNNDYFNVEKSHDGSIFEDIGIVQGAGFSNSLIYYSLTDAYPYSDINYYRLKQTDFNGNFTYSGVISSLCSNDASLAMLISQSDYGINVFITSGNNKNIALSVFDISGKMIFYKHINTIDDPLTISPNLFSSGIYLFRLQSETAVVVKKAMIK